MKVVTCPSAFPSSAVRSQIAIDSHWLLMKVDHLRWRSGEYACSRLAKTEDKWALEVTIKGGGGASFVRREMHFTLKQLKCVFGIPNHLQWLAEPVLYPSRTNLIPISDPARIESLVGLVKLKPKTLIWPARNSVSGLRYLPPMWSLSFDIRCTSLELTIRMRITCIAM